MLLTTYWEIGWDSYPTCPPRWQYNSLQVQEEGASERVIGRYPNSTPREDVAAAEEEDAGRDVAATAFTTIYLTDTT